MPGFTRLPIPSKIGAAADIGALPVLNPAFNGTLTGPAIAASGNVTGANLSGENTGDTSVSVKIFGAVGDGIADDTAALQAALDSAAAGCVVFLPRGTYLITDTLYVPAGVTLIGESAGDNWGVTSSTKGSCIKTSGAGVLRIWTDVGLAGTAAGTLVDEPMSVAIAITGTGCTFENLTLEGGSQTDGSDAWGAGFFNASVRRTTFIGVETTGRFLTSGCYIDATWSNTNTALQTLHTSTYGRTVASDQASNEVTFYGCWFKGGNWGLFLKGTNRTDVTANVWSPGGVSDLNDFGSRISNTPIGTAPNYPEFSGAYYRDLHNNFQNRYFHGTAFRSSSGYSVFLDRGRFENFIGLYGESRGTNSLTQLVTLTVDALGVVPESYGSGQHWTGASGDQPVIWRVYLTNASRIDTMALNLRPDATLTTATGTFVAYAYGYDATAGRAYVLSTDDVQSTVTAGQTLTQAAGQSSTRVFYATERSSSTVSSGQSGFVTADADASFYGAASQSLGGNLRSRGLFSSGAAAHIGARDIVDINCEAASQVNLWVNKFGTSGLTPSRLRWFGTSLDSYNASDLGSTARPWGTAWIAALNINGVDATPISGTWTPVLRGSTTAGTNTYTTQSGRYTKVGNRVNASGIITISGGVDAAMAGNMQISGLPYAVLNDPGAWSGVVFSRVLNTNLAASTNLIGQASGNSTTITLIERGNTGDTTITSTAKFGSAFQIRFNLSYEV